MRIWLPILVGATLLAAGGMVFSATNAQVARNKAAPTPSPAPAAARSFHDFTLTSIDGKPMPLSAWRGQVVLLVNTASFCGFTPQYEGLQKLHAGLAPRGFTVIGVPSGDFMSQEHDSNAKIKDFCETQFGITFPLAEKAHVRGERAIPLYRWVRASLPETGEPKWNFHKILIGKDGRAIAGFGSRVAPDSPELRSAIEKALAA